MKLPRGAVLYEGPSMLDGAPIVAIATFTSRNRKTGPMAQTWIMRSDISPTEAIMDGRDSSVCGGCPQRHFLKGACYVEVARAPLGVWRAYKRGVYSQPLPISVFERFKVRIGSYGDPSSVPASVWNELIQHARGWTAYSHHPKVQPELIKLAMISADTPAQARSYQAKGYKTFRVKTEDQPLMKGEIECLADTQGITCMECGICNASGPSVAINVHGSLKGRYIDKYGSAA